MKFHRDPALWSLFMVGLSAVGLSETISADSGFRLFNSLWNMQCNANTCRATRTITEVGNRIAFLYDRLC